MSHVYTFHKTVIGYLHVQNHFPLEDASFSFSSEDGRYHIAVVADGHGSAACFRSERGSKIAVEAASGCMRQFAETCLQSDEVENRFYGDLFSNPRYRQMTLRHLTDTIIREWYDHVREDYEKDPPSLEEMGEHAERYRNGENFAHIYGTTLIAALQLPKCLILLQQGDGRCDVFFSDGSVEQPIPWDPRCQDTTTTSMCDEDAAESFRSCVLDLTRKPVMACYLGCDGVEDAYRDTYEGLGGSHVLMGGVHTFYKDLTCRIAESGPDEFEAYLEEMLPGFSERGLFSRSGSGDDVSVAGIVDPEAVKPFADAFRTDVKRYALEEALFWKEDELRGKTRKHGILQRRAREAEEALEGCQNRVKEQKEELASLEDQRRALEEKIGPGSARLEKLLRSCMDQISAAEDELAAEEKKLRELEAEREESQSAYLEYDARFRAIDADRQRIAEELARLTAEE